MNSLCVRFIFLLQVCWMFTGCATIFNGGKQPISIITEPAGAQINIGDGLATCVSPCKVDLDVKPTLPIVITLDGYYKLESEIRRSYAYSFYANILMGVYGLIGMGIDHYTGRAWGWHNDEFTLAAVVTPPTNDEIREENAANDSNHQQKTPAPMAPSPPVKSSLPTEVKHTVTEPNPSTQARQKFTETDVKRKIEWHFGPQTDQILKHHVTCVYEFLEADHDGQAPSLDDAIRATYGRNSDSCVE